MVEEVPDGNISSFFTVFCWFLRRQYKKSIRAYEKLLDFVMPDTFSLTLHSLSTFITEANVWSVEFFCIELLKRLLIDNSKAEETMDYLLSEYISKCNGFTKSPRLIQEKLAISGL